MKRIITTEKQPIRLRLDEMDAGAFDQARNLANLPLVFKHIAVMPDAHQGYGMPIGGVTASEEMAAPVFFEPMLNIAHNHAALEEHFHREGMAHRKRATRAREGELGIIPGSQGTPSYIVRGKGNRESFASCSHGAGRKMGRKQAQRRLELEQEN